MAYGIFGQFGSAFVEAARAFRASFMGKSEAPTFESYDARIVRYSILWAMYENSVYEDIHSFAATYRTNYGLYRYTRGVYNPVLRLGDFWRSHLLGGSLDMDAGDGTQKPSCLPIVTDNKQLRSAISIVWKNSNMQRLKDILSLRTTVMGDGVLRVDDDPVKEKISISWLNPSYLKDVMLDNAGNVKAYTIEYKRPHPIIPNRTALYTETAERDGIDVVYTTYLDNSMFAWDGESAQWAVPYGFIPLVVFQHNNVGLKWGWSELQAGMAKFREVDDLASKTHDYIRKVVDAPMLFAGVKAPDENNGGVKVGKQNRSLNKPQIGREEVPAIYSSDPNAKAVPIVATLDIAAALQGIQNVLKTLEYDYPELSTDIHNIQGDVSGRALRENRNPAETKVLMRRGDYDDAIIRVQKMAVAIGGWRKYQGFQSFGLDSFARGDLEHSIGERPVFSKDPLDDIERDAAFWDLAGKAKLAGVPLPVFLEQQGWTKEKINQIITSDEYQMRMETTRLAVEGAKQSIVNGGANNNPNNFRQPARNNNNQNGNRNNSNSRVSAR